MKKMTEKQIGYIVFFFALLFLITISSCFSQGISRMVFDYDGKPVVRKYITDCLVFKSPLASKEEILFSAYSDSIDENRITFQIFAYFPKNINPKGESLVLTYMDGTQDVYVQSLFNADDNYAEYESIQNINNIAYRKIKSIYIRSIGKYDDINKNYFIDFIAKL